MANDPYIPMKREEDEIQELAKINESFKSAELIKRLRIIEKLGKELEVGGQTSYQNKRFVLNEVEFPEGTSGKSRQAIFEAAVRVDSLRGLVFDYNKTVGEIKIAKAKLMRAEDKRENGETEADRLEADGEYDVAMTELRQKEQALIGMEQRSKHLLRNIHDFYEEFEINEEKCKALGFDCHAWNDMRIEDHYWRTVNDKKIIKQKMYALGGLTKEGGDALPLQNSLDLTRVQLIGNEVQNQVRQLTQSTQQQSSDGLINESRDPASIDARDWNVEINGEMVKKDSCSFKDVKGRCAFRDEIIGACTFRYCNSLGHNLTPIS